MTDIEPTVRFLHSADWQLGMTRARLSEEAGNRFVQERMDAVARLGALVRQHRAEFVVVAGDVFESNQLSRQTLLRSLDALRAIPVPVFLLPGNHDPLETSAILRTPELAELSHVIVLENDEPVAVPGLREVEVVGAPWLNKRPGRDLVTNLCEGLQPASGLRIAVAHGAIREQAPDPTVPELIQLAHAEAALTEHRFDYLALGDRHSTTAVGSSGRIWYSGTPVVTDFRETDPNQVLLVDLSRAHCTVTPIRTSDWTFERRTFDLNGPEDLAQLRTWLEALPNKACSAVRLGLVGTLNLRDSAELDDLLDSQRERFASLTLSAGRTDLAVVPDALDDAATELGGYLKSAWHELQSAAVTGDAEAEDALRLLYRLNRQVAD